MVGGKRYYCYRKLGTDESFTSKKAALSYEPFFIAEVMGAKTKKEIPLNEVLFEAYYLYMKGKLKPSTYYGYVNTFQKHWLRHFKGLNLSSIDNNLLETICAKVFKGKSNHQGKAASGELFVKFLRKKKPDLDDTIVCAPKKSDPETHEYHIYSEEEFSRFISVIEDKRERFLFLILFHYGLRISECLALKWSDFKEDGLYIERSACVKNDTGTVIFTSPKTSNSYRVYPLIKQLEPYVNGLELRHGEFIFPGKFGNSVLGQSHVRRHVEKYAKMAGVKTIRLHEFRHSCVSNLLMHKLPVRLVARWVGDTESMVLNTYSLLLPSEKMTIADFINDNM